MIKDYKTDISTVLTDLFNFKHIQNKNEIQSKYEGYYFKKNHIYRLEYVASKISPFIKPNSKVLDLGSDGVFPFLIKKMGENIDSFAVSKKDETIVFNGNGEILSFNKLQFSGTSDNNFSIQIKKCDIEKDRLPFEDNSIDIITCFEVLEHLKSDPMHLMTEVNRIIKRPGGLFFFTTPNINSLKALKRMLCLESPYFYPPYFQEDREIGHFKEYSINEIKLLLKKGGFSILKMDTFDHVNNDIFDHNKAYQARQFIGATREEADESDLENSLNELLGKLQWDKRLNGDYMFICSEWAGEIDERYYFPLYE